MFKYMFRQNTSVPAMSTKITIYRNDEKPRYIQSNCGIPPNSPSKVSDINIYMYIVIQYCISSVYCVLFQRLKDRQMNSVLTTNQSVINTQRDNVCLKNDIKPVPPMINQKPKTINNNMETFNKSSNISERLKINNIPSLLNLNTSIPTSFQSEVLSPLSPGQVLADGKMPQSQWSSMNSSVSNYSI